MLIGRVNKVGLCSISSPTRASKALLCARATATVYAIVPIEVPLTSVGLKYKWFVSARLGRLHGCLFGCLHFQLRKDLDAIVVFNAVCTGFSCNKTVSPVAAQGFAVRVAAGRDGATSQCSAGGLLYLRFTP